MTTHFTKHDMNIASDVSSLKTDMKYVVAMVKKIEANCVACKPQPPQSSPVQMSIPYRAWAGIFGMCVLISSAIFAALPQASTTATPQPDVMDGLAKLGKLLIKVVTP